MNDPIKEGDVFYPKRAKSRASHRRIIRVLGDQIAYSTGGDGKPRTVFASTILRWGHREAPSALGGGTLRQTDLFE